MLSKRVGFGLGAVVLFLVAVAFILGKPAHRDARLYPIIRQYTPFVIEKTLGGLKILRKDNPKFKEEPDAIHFYSRLQELEREWASKHLKLKGETLIILDSSSKELKKIPLKSEKEKHFIENYYQVKDK